MGLASLDALNKLSKKAFAGASIDPEDLETATKLKVSTSKLPPGAPNPASKGPLLRKRRGGITMTSNSPKLIGKLDSRRWRVHFKITGDEYVDEVSETSSFSSLPWKKTAHGNQIRG